jgi:hypothetical protein
MIRLVGAYWEDGFVTGTGGLPVELLYERVGFAQEELGLDLELAGSWTDPQRRSRALLDLRANRLLDLLGRRADDQHDDEPDGAVWRGTTGLTRAWRQLQTLGGEARVSVNRVASNTALAAAEESAEDGTDGKSVGLTLRARESRKDDRVDHLMSQAVGDDWKQGFDGIGGSCPISHLCRLVLGLKEEGICLEVTWTRRPSDRQERARLILDLLARPDAKAFFSTTRKAEQEGRQTAREQSSEWLIDDTVVLDGIDERDLKTAFLQARRLLRRVFAWAVIHAPEDQEGDDLFADIPELRYDPASRLPGARSKGAA